MRSLQPAQVHIVLTVRDMATLLPAEWQETVKHRNARSWEDWLGDVIDRESVDADRRQWWFWRVHDTLAILRLWAEQVPPERIHVVTNPPRGSAAGLLWERFASLLGIDPASADLSRARPNASLGHGRDRVPAAAERGAARPGRRPRLVLHVEREGDGGPPGAGRPARAGAWSCPPTGTPGPRNSPRPSSAGCAPAAIRSPVTSTTCARRRSGNGPVTEEPGRRPSGGSRGVAPPG